MYANISDSMFSGTFRENNFAPISGFNAIAIIGTNNMINGVRAYQETARSSAYIMHIHAGNSGSCTLSNVDLRDYVTRVDACLLLTGNVQKFNVRTNGRYDQNINAVQVVQPQFGSHVMIDLSQGTSFMIIVDRNLPFEIDNAINATAGQRFTVQVWNQTAAVIQQPTWGTGYRFAGWLSPAGGTHRCIEFECNAKREGFLRNQSHSRECAELTLFPVARIRLGCPKIVLW